MDAHTPRSFSGGARPAGRHRLVWAAVFCFVFTLTTTALAVCAGLPLVAAGTGALPSRVSWLVAVWWAVAALTVPVAIRIIDSPPPVVMAVCAGVHVLCASFAATLAGTEGIIILWVLAAVAAGCATPAVARLSAGLPRGRFGGLGVLKLAVATAMTVGVPATVAVSWFGPRPDWQRLFYVLAVLGVVCLGMAVVAVKPAAHPSAGPDHPGGMHRHTPGQATKNTRPAYAGTVPITGGGFVAASLASGALATGMLVTTATTLAPAAGGGDPGAAIVFAAVGATGLVGAGLGGLPRFQRHPDARLSATVACLLAELVLVAVAAAVQPVASFLVTALVCAIGATGGLAIRLFRDITAGQIDPAGSGPDDPPAGALPRVGVIAGCPAAAGAVAGGLLLDHLSWLIPLCAAAAVAVSLVLLRLARGGRSRPDAAGHTEQSPDSNAMTGCQPHPTGPRPARGPKPHRDNRRRVPRRPPPRHSNRP